MSVLDNLEDERLRAEAAKAIASGWVREEGQRTPGFTGAFFHGSVNWLSEHDELPVGSDLDVMLAIDGPEPREKPGKFVFEGVTLEVSYLSNDALQTKEQILGDYSLAGSFHRPSVIADPRGTLVPLQEAVAREYAKRHWVEVRRDDAIARAERNLAALRAGGSLPDQVTSWFFAAGVLTHVLLVAGLKNPTVRKRYVAVRSLLEEYGRANFYEELLALINCDRLSKEPVAAMLARLTRLFDTVKDGEKGAFFFASDISDDGRAIAIDGSRELIEQGFHREAVFWIVATYCRCMKVLAANGPAEQISRFEADFRDLLEALDGATREALEQRANEIKRMIPSVRELSEYIMDKNPGIEGDKHAQG